MAGREPVIHRLVAQAFAGRVSHMPHRRDIVGVATMKRTPSTHQPKPKPGAAGPRSTGRLQRAIDEVVKREIEAALRESGGNVAASARALGITEMAIRKRLRSLRIDPDTYR